MHLYGHDVVVYTDHSTVKAVLETPNPSGKHARWWSKVFGSGVRNLSRLCTGQAKRMEMLMPCPNVLMETNLQKYHSLMCT